jgi:AraC-like DNA-binding protein/predicted transcriptional regulator YdeE
LNAYYLERIQRGVDYVEAHLEEEIALSVVAKAGGLSQWHFQRIFKALTGETLKTYIRSRRLANTLDRLLDTDLRILDIALLAGFETQESFARAFRSAFSMTPTEYRRLKKRSLFIRKLRLDEAMLKHIQGGVSIEPEIVRQAALRLIGLRTTFHGVDSEKNNLGEKLPPLWASFMSRLPEVKHACPGICYGVVRSLHADDDLLEYHAAIEVVGEGLVPEGMALIEVPAGTYARFEHRGEAQAIDRTVSYAYSTWLLQSGHQHSGGPDLEFYDHRYHPTDPSSVIGYALPIE